MEDDPRTAVPPSSSGLTNDISREACTWGMLCHLSAFLGFLWFPLSSFLPIPFGHLLGPFVCWLLKKNDYAFVDEQGKESLNFQISMTIYGALASLFIIVVIGLFMLAVLAVANMILVIIASVNASNGKSYKYPFTIRFLK